MPQPVSVEAARAGRPVEGRRLGKTELGRQVLDPILQGTWRLTRGRGWAGGSNQNMAELLGSEQSPFSQYHPQPWSQLSLPPGARGCLSGGLRGAVCGPEIRGLHQQAQVGDLELANPAVLRSWAGGAGACGSQADGRAELKTRPHGSAHPPGLGVGWDGHAGSSWACL